MMVAQSPLEAKLMQELLLQIGELRAQVASLHDLVNGRLGERDHVLVGWKEIAAYVGRSVRQVQRLGDVRRCMDPLPHRRDGGYVIAYASQINAWKARAEVVRRRGHSMVKAANERRR